MWLSQISQLMKHFLIAVKCNPTFISVVLALRFFVTGYFWLWMKFFFMLKKLQGKVCHGKPSTKVSYAKDTCIWEAFIFYVDSENKAIPCKDDTLLVLLPLLPQNLSIPQLKLGEPMWLSRITWLMRHFLIAMKCNCASILVVLASSLFVMGYFSPFDYEWK